MRSSIGRQRRARTLRLRDRRGVVLIEAALLLMPFLALISGIIETGIYFVNQFSLDAGVLVTAEAQNAAMLSAASSLSPYTLPTGIVLHSTIAANGGSLLAVSGMVVDVRLLSNLSSAAVPIADGTEDITTCVSGAVLVLRAQASVTWMVLGVSTLTIASSAMIRCPNTT